MDTNDTKSEVCLESEGESFDPNNNFCQEQRPNTEPKLAVKENQKRFAEV